MARKTWLVPLAVVALIGFAGCTSKTSELDEADDSQAEFLPVAMRQPSKRRVESVPMPAPTWPPPATSLDLDESTREQLHRLVRERATALKARDLARLSESKPNPDDAHSPENLPAPADLFHWFPQGVESESYRFKKDGYHSDVAVGAPGRLDWVFAVNTNSIDKDAARLPEGYESTEQSYELFVPPGYRPDKAAPLILHVDPGERSSGWRLWKTVCQRHGVFFAGPHHAGNAESVERPVRRRIVLDVLDDVRRRYSIDPDRTYLTGISGGGNAAARIAYALPEHFGGLAAIVGVWGMRPEPWLRQRAKERLSIAILTGERDFNRNELELEYFSFLKEYGVRSMLHVYPRIGHQPPNPAQLEEVFQWLEAGLPDRQLSARRYPASRLPGPATADEWSRSLILEAAARLRSPDSLAMAIFLLEGVVERWPRTPAADFSRELLREFDTHASVPSRDILRSEKLRFTLLEARCHDASYAAGPPAGYPVPWTTRTQIAVECWNEVLRLAPAGSDEAQKAQARLDTLRKGPN
jgi:hypothetical protein